MIQVNDYVEANFAEYPGTFKDLDISVAKLRGVCRVKGINRDRGMALVTSIMRPRGLWAPLFALNQTTHHHSERQGIPR